MSYLKEYQKKLGLVADGVIGKNTVQAMMEDLNVTDKLLFAHMMGQMWHESGNFEAGRENLNYSADGLVKTWSTRFRRRLPGESVAVSTGSDGKAIADFYARNPEKIGNRVYADRMGNGNEASGDGWKYRGIFGLQLTGKTNITKFMRSVGLSDHTDPETLLNDPRLYFLAGLFWFKDNGVDKLCTDKTITCITKVTKRVNGGTNGLEDRVAKTTKMFGLMGL
jgi:putative chitinase